MSLSNATSDDPGPRAALAVWLSLALIALVIVGFIFAAPLARAGGHDQFAAAIYSAFSHVCHQIPERSFHVAGYKFGVCSRCTGLYSGIALATLAYPLARPLRRPTTPRLLWLILAAVPIAVDFSLGYFNIWHNTHVSRFLTGALLGSVAMFYIVPGLLEVAGMLARLRERQNSSPITSRY